MSDHGSPPPPPAKSESQPEHLNIKVTDSNNEVFFKIKRTTQLKKLMDAFCERSGKAPTSVRFLYDGTRVMPTDSPESVSLPFFTNLEFRNQFLSNLYFCFDIHVLMLAQLEMEDGDSLEVHHEQFGGCCR